MNAVGKERTILTAALAPNRLRARTSRLSSQCTKPETREQKCQGPESESSSKWQSTSGRYGGNAFPEWPKGAFPKTSCRRHEVLSALALVLLAPEAALANGSFLLLGYVLTLPLALLGAILAANVSGMIKPFIIKMVLRAAVGRPDVEAVEKSAKIEWILTTISYVLMIPLWKTLTDISDVEPIILKAAPVCLLLIIPAVGALSKNRQLVADLAVENGEAVSNARRAMCSLVAGLVTPCVFGLFVFMLVWVSLFLGFK